MSIIENTVNRFNRIGREKATKSVKSKADKAKREGKISKRDLLKLCTLRCLLESTKR